MKTPETDNGKKLYEDIKLLVQKGKPAHIVMKAKRLLAELETGFGSESMFIAGATILLDSRKSKKKS